MRTPVRLLTLTATALCVLLASVLPAAASAGWTRQVTVMTRNLYVGGDITKPIAAAAGKTGQEALLAFGRANYTLRTTVDSTNFPVRSKLLAAEIAAAGPDLVGLQEVALWRHGPLQLEQLGVPNATTVDYDFLALLLEALRQRGARYRAVAVQVSSDIEAPAFQATPTDGTGRDERLTVRDVVLVRQGAGVDVRNSGGGQYLNHLTASLAGSTVSIVRGYTWADVRVRGTRTFRFLNTHLESVSSDLALAQAQELLVGPAAVSRPVVIVCDCNSDPLNSTPKFGSVTPRNAAYNLLVGPGGLTDEWLTARHRTGPGLTSGFRETVDDPDASGLRIRIDLVLARSTPRVRITAFRAWLTGDTVADRDPATGLWPSDHAGLVAELRFRETYR